MNWKIVECNLLLIIGIVVLACWDSPTEMGAIYWPRLAVIGTFVILLVLLPFINRWHTIDKVKAKTDECQKLQTEVDTLGMKKKKLEDDIEKKNGKIQELEKEIEKLKAELNKKVSYRTDLFYDFLLIKWAKEHYAPFTTKPFEDIKNEFEKYYQDIN